MANTPGKGVSESDRKKGHYRAYDTAGNVIWEQKEFVIGVDKIPPGLSDGMKAMTIRDGKTVVAKWNPHHLPTP